MPTAEQSTLIKARINPFNVGDQTLDTEHNFSVCNDHAYVDVLDFVLA